MIDEIKYAEIRFVTHEIVEYWIADKSTKTGFRPVYFKHISN